MDIGKSKALRHSNAIPGILELQNESACRDRHRYYDVGSY